MTDPAPKPKHRSRRGRLAPLAWISGLAAAVVLVLGVTGTLSSWTTAIITNQANQAGTTQAVILQETGNNAAGTPVTCTSTDTAGVSNTFTCTTINKYGANGGVNLNLAPGGTSTTTVVFKNTGGASASSFKLAPGTCASAYQSPLTGTPATGLCDQLMVGIVCTPSATGAASLTYTATSLTNFTATQTFGGSGLAPGQSTSCVFTLSLPAGTSPTYAGQTATQNLTWTLAV